MNWPTHIHLTELRILWRILLFIMLALGCMPLK